MTSSEKPQKRTRRTEFKYKFFIPWQNIYCLVSLVVSYIFDNACYDGLDDINYRKKKKEVR